MALAIAQSVAAGVTTGNITLPSWTPGSNELVLIYIYAEQTDLTPSIAGNGLTFVLVDSFQGADESWVYRAMVSSPTTGSIVVTLTGNTNDAQAIAMRISGCDTSGTNGSGAVEANNRANATNNDAKCSVTTLTANAFVVGFLGIPSALNTLTVPGDETTIDINNIQGTSTISTWYLAAGATGSYEIGADNDLSSPFNGWVLFALSIKPASPKSLLFFMRPMRHMIIR